MFEIINIWFKYIFKPDIFFFKFIAIYVTIYIIGGKNLIKIDNVKVYSDLNIIELKELICKKYKIDINDISDFHISKKSIDARDKSKVHYVYSFNIFCKNENKYSRYIVNEEDIKEDIVLKRNSKFRPVIVGFGPAGMFCALELIKYGIKPIILEQGKKVEERIKDVEEYKKTAKVNELSNVQFGEGGAGTFSDGKLNTGTHSVYIKKVLETFTNFGAPEEILYLNKPHIGTDNLVKIVKNIREYIISNGGDILFNSKFTDFEVDGGKVVSAIYNGTEKIETDTIILAMGHSSRDLFNLLKVKNIKMERKNFSVGVRIEHPQTLINESQYGDKTDLKLPPADYKLVYHGENNRSCYSFCMCPGGEVIASSSEKESIVTNGMSNFSRNGKNANSALLVNVTPDDFNGSDVLAGVEFQRKLEKEAYILGGSNGCAPAERVGDFLNSSGKADNNKVIPTYKPGVKFTDLNLLFPDYITQTLKEALKYFGKKIKGFDMNEAVLTAVETRSSSPVKVIRDENTFMSVSVKGLYLSGEGPGYAGGITSSAVDGIKVAHSIILNK